MTRTSLKDRLLPNYTRNEEIFNMISHIVGGSFGICALIACVIVAAYNQNVWGIVGGIIYGVTIILLFTMSSLYHGLKSGTPKKVFQIIDHCTIFLFIAGTYTPIMLGKFRILYKADAIILIIVIWAIAIFGIVLNSIDLKRYRKLSLVCYLAMGWISVIKLNALIDTHGINFFLFLLFGGIAYTIGAILYVIGKNKKYMHSVFHVFVVIASVLHFVGIITYVMPVC